jgi:hypothetical protein
MGAVNFKKSMWAKRREKDFWFRLKSMFSFSIFPKKIQRLSRPVKESVSLS